MYKNYIGTISKTLGLLQLFFGVCRRPGRGRGRRNSADLWNVLTRAHSTFATR